jgi:hypothetical protein
MLLAKSGDAISVAGDLVIGDGAGGYRRDGVTIEADEQIADTATVTVNSCGELTLFGYSSTDPYPALSSSNVETFNTLWVNGTGYVGTDSGRIALGADTGSGTGIVVNAGTLGGNGAITDPVTVLSGTLVAGYTNAGTLTVSNDVSIGASGIVQFSLADGTNTSLVVTGDLTLNGTLTLSMDPGLAPAIGTYYGLIKTDGTVNGSFINNTASATDWSMKIIYTGNITAGGVSPTGGNDVIGVAVAHGTVVIIK